MKRYFKLLVHLIIIIVPVLFFSESLFRIWGGGREGADVKPVRADRQWTLSRFSAENGLTPDILARLFPVRKLDDGKEGLVLNRTLEELMGMSSAAVAGPSNMDELKLRTRRLLMMKAERASRNWKKIVAKFILWAIFMAVCLRMLMKGTLAGKARSALYMVAIYVFGVILGADPSPMGTVKDAVVLLGREGIIFPPRMIAFLIFAATVLVANKFICSWGCQLGALQDMLFRLNRDTEDRQARTVQFKLPFLFTNTVRVIFFGAIVWFAFSAGRDLVEPIDPFRVFKPSTLGGAGALFLAGLVLSSLFLYRPWCHLFCPFGLAGWVVEQFSILRIRVNKDRCVSCGACERACPSTVMASYLREDRVRPDCFSCGVCVEVCPKGAICYGKKGACRGESADGQSNL